MQIAPTPFVTEISGYYWNLRGRSLPYGLGCAWVGRGGAKQQAEDVATLREAYDSGCRFFDTAPAYVESELRVGEFLQDVRRETLLVASKIERMQDPGQSIARWLNDGLDACRRRLQSDVIDLLQLHDLDFTALMQADAEGELWRTVEEFKRRGAIRFFGVAVRQHWHLSLALDLPWVDSVLSYNDCTPLDPVAFDLAAKAVRQRRVFLNGSPLACRLLAGDPADVPIYPGQEERKRYAIEAYEYCCSRGVSILAAALQFPLGNPDITLTLTGPGNLSELISSREALLQPLPEDFWERWPIQWPIPRPAQQKPSITIPL